MAYKSWVFTLNNWTEKDKQQILDWDGITKMAIGEEIGEETNTPHLQGYVTFVKTKRISTLKKWHKRIHWEKAIVNDWNYCLKDQKYTIIDNRKQGVRNDIIEAKEILENGGGMIEVVTEVNSYQACRMAELYLKYAEKPRPIEKVNVINIYGKTGRGKTKLVYSRHDVTEVFRPISYKWWEGYDGHKIVLIDDFRKDFCKFHELLTLLDIYPYRVETKGGSRQVQFNTIYITSPLKITEMYDTREDVGQLHRRVTEFIEL